uniref:RRM domain-containing protein n=2 Tax=Haptolina brevifila TaxID=156173 RepID=A0A7S2JI37_9EUKA|mmetsp:Transcript_83074/g.165875  ORF Transcript_83074/g.165875 Transcript_83074/m.165875 type:complete len:795 (+) Transcript_83074:291-2675(+)
MAIVYCSCMLVVLVGLLLAQSIARWCACRDRADQLEQVLSIVFLLQLTTSWLSCLETLTPLAVPSALSLADVPSQDYYIAPACQLATVTMVLQIVLMGRFATIILAYTRGGTTGNWTRGRIMCRSWVGGLCFVTGLSLVLVPMVLTAFVAHNGVTGAQPSAWLTDATKFIAPRFGILIILWFFALFSLSCCSASGFVSCYSVGGAPSGRSPNQCPTPCDLQRVELMPRLVERRVHYLTGRFAHHSPRWQLVIWSRQLTLLLLATICRIAVTVQLTPSFSYISYVTAAVALVILMVFWRLHCRHQPYVFRIQNGLESWLYASNMLLLLLAMGYTALKERLQQQQPQQTGITLTSDRMMHRIVEAAMLSILFGGWAIAGGFSVWSLRSTRRGLSEVNIAAVLTVAEERIDEPVRQQLAAGALRLMSCAWLCSAEAEEVLQGLNSTGETIMRCLPAVAYLQPSQAVQCFDAGTRSVLVLSHPWQTFLHPDPYGSTLSCVRRYLASLDNPAACGLFWDVLCLPHMSPHSGDRFNRHASTLADVTKTMVMLYASITGTSVLQIRDVIPREERPEYDGQVVLFNLRSETSSEALWSRLGCYGEVLEVEKKRHHDGGTDIVRVRFASHEAAVKCIDGYAGDTEAEAVLLYNETPYHERGWCILEDSAAIVTLAHLEAAAAVAPLPARYAHAQACRAKLIDLPAHGTLQPRKASVSPTGLVDEALRALDGGRFTVKGDRHIAKSLLADFDWVVKRAMAQAQLDPLIQAIPLRKMVIRRAVARGTAMRHQPYIEMGNGVEERE